MANWKKSLLLVGITIALCLCVLEIGIRTVLFHPTVDGNLVYKHMQLRPYRLPVATTRQHIQDYETSVNPPIVYDMNFGWTGNPNIGDFNVDGLRANRDYAIEKPAGILRIAVFGDSFTYGSEVALTESWPYLLESRLREHGIEAEVLNFGMPGYGIDQAYLRWHHQGATYQPDIVIHGLMVADIPRNLNIFPLLALPSRNWIFSKPRFILGNETLQLINSPTIATDNMLDTIANLPSNELSAYEIYYNVADYEERWYRHSAVLSLMEEMRLRIQIHRKERPSDSIISRDYLLPHTFDKILVEGTALTRAIWNQWQSEVDAAGSQFLIVYFPRQEDVEVYQQGEVLDYATLLEFAQANYVYLDPLGRFTASSDSYFAPGSHFSQQGNEVIASFLAEKIEDLFRHS